MPQLAFELLTRGRGIERNRQQQRATGVWREEENKKQLCPQLPTVLLNSTQMAKRPVLLLLNPTWQGHLPSTSKALVRVSRLSSPMPNAQELLQPSLLPSF